MLTIFSPRFGSRAVCGVALSVAVLISPALAQTPVALDGFLAGIDRGCESSAQKKDYEASIYERFGPEPKPNAPLVLPAGVASAFGVPKVEKTDDHLNVNVPLTATYRDLRLRNLNFVLGLDNGIYSFEVEFDESADKVRAVLSSVVAKSKKILDKNNEIGATTALRFKGGKATLSCDLSN